MNANASTPESRRLAGPGGIRPIRARWVITAEMLLLSAAHIGGRGGGTFTDMPLLWHPVDDRPLLPGTTLAGALRSHLADVLGGYRSGEDPHVAGLFGAERRDDAGEQSPLITFDSLAQLPHDGAPEIRDGVAIDPKSGTAEEHKKFDLDVLPAGTVFPLRLELIVADLAQEADLLDRLRASLSGLVEGELSLGARRSRGLGQLAARRWRAHRYDLSSEDGWLAWLLSDPGLPIPGNRPPERDLDDALRGAWPAARLARLDDRRRRVTVETALQIPGGLLVRSPGTAPDAPDAAHLHSAGRPVLPGTSLAGALRSRARRIARVVAARRDDPRGTSNKWLDDLLGPRFEGTAPPPGFEPRGSRLRVLESVIEDGTPLRTTRVRIDRFTQGVTPAALFDEEPYHGGRANVRLELREPRPGETGLLLLLLKDLLSSDLPLGGTASVGRGVVTGSARLRLEDGFEFRIEPGVTPGPAALERINRAITELHERLGPPACATGVQP